MKDRRTARKVRVRRATRRVKRGGARAVAAAAPALGFFGPTRKEVIRKTVGGETFEITVFFSPHADMPADDIREIKRFFEGNRLGIDNKTIDENLAGLTWGAVVNVQNLEKPDRAVGSFQWESWCFQTDPKKLWIHDVSRISTEKGITSPTKVLFDFFKEKGVEKRLSHVYLIVDEVDKVAEAGKPSVWKILTDIYGKPDYGFVVHKSRCSIGAHKYTSMRARIP